MNELKRIFRAGGYSWQGLKAAYINEPAFRTEILLFVILAPAAVWLGQSALEYALLFSTFFLVVLAELFNSAIEVIVDRIGTEQHELSGRAKDIASAAVLLAIINFLVIWGILLYARFTG